MIRRLMLDTGPAQDFVQHVNPTYGQVREAISRGVEAGVCYPTLAELRAGFEASAAAERNLKTLNAAFKWLARWPFTLDAVRVYGELFAALRRIGRPIGKVDMQIAATALAMGRTKVVTYDSDLLAVSGLSVENWLETTS
jgi:tRNA(fMet)-specific endonuclease VapC